MRRGQDWWRTLKDRLDRPVVLRGPGAVLFLGGWLGAGAPAVSPAAGISERIQTPVGAEGPADRNGLREHTVHQATFSEVVEAARRAWSRGDAGLMVAGARQLLLQLPGTESRSSVSREQAVRLLEGVLRRSEEVTVRVVTAREVGPGQGYAELIRQYRVTGTAEARTQRILLAYRREATRGSWELVELRVLQGSG